MFWMPPSQRTGFDNIFQWEIDVPIEKQVDRTYGMCRHITLASEWAEAPNPPPLAVTKDGSDYKADLYTQATFGCVEYESKE